MTFSKSTLIAVLLAGSLACASNTAVAPPPPRPTYSTVSSPATPIVAMTGRATSGFDVANVDRSVSACKDFYRFANGGWAARNPIPPAYSRWGNFNILAEKNRDTMRTILDESARSNAPRGSVEQKVGDFYSSCMNESEIESSGLRAIEPELQRIAAIKDRNDVQDVIAHLHGLTVPALFAFGSTQDFKDSTQVTAGAGQAGLGLPDRDYYLKDDARSKEIRSEYVNHVARTFQLLGDNPAAAETKARTVIDMEAKLAAASMTNVQLRDPDALYNKRSTAELAALTPNFSWERYFRNTGVRDLSSVIVGQPEFFKEVNQQLGSRSVEDWKTYLRWHLVNSAAPYLSAPFENENFNFNERFLEGKKEMLPRWRRCVVATDTALGEALGQLYVKKAFPPQAKAEAMEMVRNLIGALRSDLTGLEWMGDVTRARAIDKLEKYATKIGYPDKWIDYSSLDLTRDVYARNAARASRFAVRRDLAKIGKPLDRTVWGMSPPTVNAYNNSQLNEIVFPAGILQPPFYDPNADEAYNYGGMGAVIGHELIHGFDDEGSKFDAQGNLSNWWSEDDRKKFDARAKCVSQQFSNFDVGNDLRMNGELVLGESIADLGGLAIAHAAYQRSLEGKTRATLDGFTPEQRFFLGWAQVWATNATPEYERLQVTTDPHPLARFRVNGPLSNMPEFAEAFSCTRGEAMVRAEKERCDIW